MGIVIICFLIGVVIGFLIPEILERLDVGGEKKDDD